MNRNNMDMRSGRQDMSDNPETKSLLNQIHQLQKTVEHLQAQQSSQGGYYGGYGGGRGGYSNGAGRGGYGGGYDQGMRGAGLLGPGGGYGMMGQDGPYSMRGNESASGFDRATRLVNNTKAVDENDPHKGERRVLVVNNIPVDLAFPQIIYEELSNYGEVQRVKVLHNKRGTALVQMKNEEVAQSVVDGQEHLNRNGFEIFVTISTKFSEVPMPVPGSREDDGHSMDFTGKIKLLGRPLNAEPQWQGNQGDGGYHEGDGEDSRNNVVILISNIPDELAQVDRIFNMVGVYGDVLCIKILRQKRDCALVHMSKPHHAAQVKQYLDQYKVMGKKLVISYSRVKSLLTGKLVEDEGLQKLFINCRSHRFRNTQQAQKITKNLGPPTTILHICNIPDSWTHEEIKELFIEHGFTAKESKDCEGKNKMCYLVFSSPDEALMALAEMHNFCSEEMKNNEKTSRGLCVSFSNSIREKGDRGQ